MKDYDFLVIGSGIAGLSYAVQVAKYGKAAVVTKSEMQKTNTDYAQGGIAAVISKTDSFSEHIQDTYIAGAELGKKEVIKAIVEEGPEAIQFLIDIGTRFTVRNKNVNPQFENLSLTREGGHSHHRIAYAADSTGHEIMEALMLAVKNHPNIDIFENHMAIDLITQHHVPEQHNFIPGITCWGAYVLNIETGEVNIFRAKKTLLATGGGSQVYINTTNPDIATGDGYAMARLAGARLANMEFVQFHPTAFFSHTGKTFLISEAVRGEGAVLRLQNGETFMEKYHSSGCLAPRDVVARAIDCELKKRNEKFLYLDATGVDHDELKSHFPYIDKKLRKQGIDFTKDPVPVVPAAHYFCGGILSTVDGKTDIRNLYTAGETACSGLHGANRLASNSLLEAVVIACRAANNPSNLKEVRFPEIPEWKEVGAFNENEWVIISHNREIIRKIMQGYVGITRSKRLLKYAENRLFNIYTEINNFYQRNSVKKEVIETRNLAITAIAIIRSGLQRKESRGLHYMTDYRERNDCEYRKDTII
ncbi:MAG: L-aspartate oxidase [Candidatus Cloacimonadota bacterium]|nr:MAG: L-aspartate oxidase [Candidatus Cloacimonadota bacterium]